MSGYKFSIFLVFIGNRELDIHNTDFLNSPFIGLIKFIIIIIVIINIIIINIIIIRVDMWSCDLGYLRDTATNGSIFRILVPVKIGCHGCSEKHLFPKLPLQ